MIYLDSCLVIYLLDDPTGRGAQVRAAMARFGDQGFAASGLVHTECLVGPMRSGDAVARRAYELVLGQLIPVRLGREVFIRAAELRAQSGLRTPDALHLAAALESGCRALWTNDGRLSRASGLAVNILDCDL